MISSRICRLLNLDSRIERKLSELCPPDMSGNAFIRLCIHNEIERRQPGVKIVETREGKGRRLYTEIWEEDQSES